MTMRPGTSSDATTDNVTRIQCWSGPRNVSTALMYAWRQRADTTVYDQDLTGPLCLVMGAEGEGMRRLTLENCDFLVKLPMAGTVESLNVSVATGICLFEAVRQRAQ